ncbi:hypothetical protein [Romboutsia sp. 1001713B170207_170306_H8]|uniref:hypothetical protein n=1 Tax=Romboutsia sp. 1001713B170207_170306_H8 TaxID=2787112 RepID=UPI00189B4A89|nr:hypothetical protein [Romboutsia sp. 1001713B170207_170306_H8]
MYKYRDVEGYYDLNDIDAFIFEKFCEKFYDVWEFPQKVAPVRIFRVEECNLNYLRVDLKDGDWLHIINDRGKIEWY